MERHKCFDKSAMDTIPYQDAFPLADTVLCVRIMGFLCARFLRLIKCHMYGPTTNVIVTEVQVNVW